MPPETYAVTVQAPAIQGIDPTTAKQALQVAIKIGAAIARKDYLAAVMLGLQFVALFAPEPDAPPAPIGAAE